MIYNFGEDWLQVSRGKSAVAPVPSEDDDENEVSRAGPPYHTHDCATLNE